MPADAAPLAALAARTFRDTFAASNTEDDMEHFLASTYGVEQQSAELMDSDVTTLLAEVDGDLAGYAQVRTGHTPDCVRGEAPVELWRFYVDQPWLGRGVAR